MPTLGNQNIANLNVNVTSNVTGVTAQLSSLQKALNSLKSQSSFSIPGLSQATTQLTGLTNSVRSLTSSVSGLGQGTANVSNQFINMGRSGSGITNMLLGWNIAGKTISTSLSSSLSTAFSGLSTGLRGLKDGPALFTALWRTSNQSNLSIRTLYGLITQGPAPSNGFGITANQIRTLHNSLGAGLLYLKDGFKALGPVIAGAFTVGIVAAGALLAKITELTAKFIKFGFEYNAMMEQMKTGYDVMLQGSNNAKGYGEAQSLSLMSQLKSFANVTPFTMPQVAKGADLLLGYGVGEGSKDQVTKVMAAVQMLGDVSRGIPEKFNDIAYAFGQVTAMGRLQGQELRQMINAGWNPLMEMVTKDRNMEQLKKDMEDGAISIDDVTRALIKATSEGGRFYKMMEKQSQTGIGRWSTLTDKASMLVGNATLSLFEAMKPILDDIINLLDSFMANARVIGYILKENLVEPVKECFKQLLQLVGLTDSGVSGFNNITEAVDRWTKALGAGLKALMVIFNVVTIIGSVFATGFLTAGTIVTEVILTIAAGIETLAFGIPGVIEWAFKKAWNATVVRFINPLVNWWNAFQAKLGTGFYIKGAGQFDESFNNTWGGSRFTSSMETITKSMKGTWDTYKTLGQGFSDLSANALKNLLGGTSDVDAFLKKIQPDPNKKGYQPVDVKSLLGAIGSTKAGKEALDKMNDSANKLAESIKGIADRFVSMGNVFEKVSYEKFSPYKLQVRMGRFLQEIQSWSKNLATLSAQGVPQGMIQELRGMGMQGYGMTKAMVNSSDAQRKSLIDNYQKAKGIGYNEADKKAKFDNMINNITITGNSVVSPELVDILATKVVEKIRKLGG